jgi:type I restriction enzyme S subunit
MSTELKPGYKQTEVGVIPEEWKTPTVRGLASSARNAIVGGPFGSDLVSRDYVEHGVPVIRGQNMGGQWVSGNFVFVTPEKAKSLEANLARPGDIVFTQRGTLGQVSLVPEKPFESYLVSQSQMKLSVNQEVADPLFYFYVFTSEKQQELIRGCTIQTGVPHINLGILCDMLVQLPPPPEQRAIAEALSDVDALIGALDQLIAKKRDLKQAAMQQLLTGQHRLPGFSGEWAGALFEHVLVRVNAKEHQIQTSEYQTTGIFPVVDQGKELVVGFSDRADKRFRCPQDGVIVFGDHTCIVKFIDFDFVVGADGTQILAAKAGHYARFHAFQLQHHEIPSTGYNRHFKFLKERVFVAPSLPEQTAIATVLSDMDAELTALEQRRDKTRALKQGMMQELLTGRIRLV